MTRRSTRDAFIEAMFAARHRLQRALHPAAPAALLARRYGLAPAKFPHSQRAFERMVSLPLYTRMSDADAERVCAAVASALV